MNQHLAELILLLARNEVILSCQQDLLLQTYHGSMFDLLLSLSPLQEHGDIQPRRCIENVRLLMQKYCSNNELLLATRAFSGTTYIDYTTFSTRILKRQSLWHNCNYSTCEKVAAFVETAQSHTSSQRALDHGRQGKHVKHFHLRTQTASSVVAHTLRQLLLNELTIERLNESKRRNVAGHVQFNIPGIFATIAAYDYDDSSTATTSATDRRERNENWDNSGNSGNSGNSDTYASLASLSSAKVVTLQALQLFCLQYNVVLEKSHLRALTYRYQKSTNSTSCEEPQHGFDYNEFSSMILELKAAEYDYYDRQHAVMTMNHRNRSRLSAAAVSAGVATAGTATAVSNTLGRRIQNEETEKILAPIQSTVVRNHFLNKMTRRR